ncbi:MAG TPA: hypothetical protein VMS93_03390, partial [Candidatus Saccharimonadales bacterium]|nr:hypothetical protein [Candidatus Saccharimonadales bacterium]
MPDPGALRTAPPPAAPAGPARPAERGATSPGPGGLAVLTACPECGAPVRMDAGSRFVRCDFCRRPHFVRGRRDYLTTFLDPHITPEDALLAAKRHLRESQVHATEVGEPELLLAPYWRLRARLFKWLRGFRPLPGGPGDAPMAGTHTEVLGRDFD